MQIVGSKSYRFKSWGVDRESCWSFKPYGWTPGPTRCAGVPHFQTDVLLSSRCPYTHTAYLLVVAESNISVSLIRTEMYLSPSLPTRHCIDALLVLYMLKRKRRGTPTVTWTGWDDGHEWLGKVWVMTGGSKTYDIRTMGNTRGLKLWTSKVHLFCWPISMALEFVRIPLLV